MRISWESGLANQRLPPPPGDEEEQQGPEEAPYEGPTVEELDREVERRRLQNSIMARAQRLANPRELDTFNPNWHQSQELPLGEATMWGLGGGMAGSVMGAMAGEAIRGGVIAGSVGRGALFGLAGGATASRGAAVGAAVGALVGAGVVIGTYYYFTAPKPAASAGAHGGGGSPTAETKGENEESGEDSGDTSATDSSDSGEASSDDSRSAGGSRSDGAESNTSAPAEKEESEGTATQPQYDVGGRGGTGPYTTQTGFSPQPDDAGGSSDSGPLKVQGTDIAGFIRGVLASKKKGHARASHATVSAISGLDLLIGPGGDGDPGGGGHIGSGPAAPDEQGHGSLTTLIGPRGIGMIGIGNVDSSDLPPWWFRREGNVKSSPAQAQGAARAKASASGIARMRGTATGPRAASAPSAPTGGGLAVTARVTANGGLLGGTARLVKKSG
jgi:hypothetical protein